MIINFSLKNFGSVKEKQALSFEADRSHHLEDAYVVTVQGHRLLKLALIYGANASGKTTILNGLDFLRQLVLSPKGKKTEKLDFQPFLFDSSSPNENSVLAIEFIQNKIKYSYEVEFFKEAIVREELYFNDPNKANVFKRKTDLSNQFTSISFGGKIKNDKIIEKTLAANTLWNNTVLGGYLKTNINLKELQEVIDWFSNYLKPMIYSRTGLEGFVTSRVDNGDISKELILDILKKADFQISDLKIRKKEENIPSTLLEFLKSQADASDDKIKTLNENSTITSFETEFEHTVNNASYSLPLESESEGTRRFYGFAGLLALLVQTSVAFPIDELEASLHPDLYLHFMLLFLLNSNQSQIIATTHNREILDNKDMFRNDAIWFTHKGEDCATELYSLADFDSSVVRDTTNVLNAYKSGKLSGSPNLSDAYLELQP